jgi:hypothetical protein
MGNIIPLTGFRDKNEPVNPFIPNTHLNLFVDDNEQIIISHFVQLAIIKAIATKDERGEGLTIADANDMDQIIFSPGIQVSEQPRTPKHIRLMVEIAEKIKMLLNLELVNYGNAGLRFSDQQNPQIAIEQWILLPSKDENCHHTFP